MRKLIEKQFGGADALLKVLASSPDSSQITPIFNDLMQLIENLLQYSHKRRLSAQEALEKYFTKDQNYGSN